MATKEQNSLSQVFNHSRPRRWGEELHVADAWEVISNNSLNLLGISVKMDKLEGLDEALVI